MLDKTYQPKNYEESIYRQWESSGAFRLKQKSNNNFVVVLPPPNANADLHVGYALDAQLKDVIARWRRLQAYNVLLLPGADHAGFETWAVYEKHLNAQGKSRFDFNREELYQQVYDFVIENKNKMQNQIRSLGISCDWQRFTFSLDDKIVKQSYATFKQMWQADLIYRGHRLVNYCVNHGTGFSDFEVNFQTVSGHLYFIKYPLSDSNQSITIATTRPETLLGDVAVAVNPSDQRYQKLVGQFLTLPIANRRIPLISHPQVLSDFGSGAVKITPGHDFLDFEIGQSANLNPLTVIDKQGKMTGDIPEQFKGLLVKEARQLIVQTLKTDGYLIKTETYQHQVGHCYKCASILEPLLAKQWFVRMQPLAQKAVEQLKSGAIKFYPASKLDELIKYLNQLQDWNISRQIAWGIPIPVFQNQAEPDDWIFDERVEQKELVIKDQTYRRDPDVFDTWWSSGQWPFATLNWQDPQVYPQALMETGVDILRPWVSRMILLGLLMTKKVPFKTVYLHGMVVDNQGAKMSKSKGNVINPMEMIEKYSSDALRLSLCTQLAAAQPQRFNQTKLIAGRNFCNKLWNIGRYLQTLTDNQTEQHLVLKAPVQLKTSADNWIWHQFLQTKQTTDVSLADYQFTNAWQQIFSFIWNDLADWYLEISKHQANPDFFNYLYINCLRLVHPFAPFVSEALYQALNPNPAQPLLIESLWPTNLEDLKADQTKVETFSQIQQVITKIRQLLPLNLQIQAQLILENPNWLKGDLKALWQLINLKQLSLARASHQSGIAVNQIEGKQAWLVLEPSLIKSHLVNLNQELIQLQKRQAQLRQRLSNPDYSNKAPQHLVAETKQQIIDTKLQFQALQQTVKDFKQAL